VVNAGGGPQAAIGVGDHVVLSFDSCGHCRSCRAAAPAYCDSFASLNLFGGREEGAPRAARGTTGSGTAGSRTVPGAAAAPGAVRTGGQGAVPGEARFTDAAGRGLAPRWFGQSSFARYALVEARNAVRVDPALPLELLGPLGCGFLTGAGAVLNTFRAGPGDTLAVFGAGAVGLAAVMAATAAGVRSVAVDRYPGRLALAERFGAIPLPAGAALPERIRRLTGGGTQYALDTTASPALVNDALRALRPTGTLGLVARLHAPLALEPGTLDRGRGVRHICEGDAVPGLLVPRLAGLWQAGRFPFDQLIRTYPLSAVNEAERDCDAGLVVKPVLLPEGRG
jgi:aryl-alcohol dehydrogenase